MADRVGDEREPARAGGLTYAGAGVDIDAGEDAVERIKAHVRSTFRPEVLGDIGGFGGLFSIAGLGVDDPVLVASTDGVGTKSAVARLTKRFDTIGVDAVAMNVDDIAVSGAEPLFFLDYLSVGRIDPATVDAIVSGVARGCREAGCALIGGEISEHPGLMDPDDFDIVGFCVGVASAPRLLPRDVGLGDVIVGFASPGLRSNGYSLARRALLERAGRSLEEPAWRGANASLGEELLRPSVIYAPAMHTLRRHVDVHAFAHVTGGGVAGNLVRVLSDGVDAVVRRGTWEEPPIFSEIQSAGDVSADEMQRVFNLGLGMLAVVDSSDATRALDSVRAAGHGCEVVGEITAGRGRAHLVAGG